MNGKMAKEYAKLLSKLWDGKHAYFPPTQFKVALGKMAPVFTGYRQHDAQELLAFLLDGLHEDLNRVKQVGVANVYMYV
jgi:ubiquitin C-terminal hydrolase